MCRRKCALYVSHSRLPSAQNMFKDNDKDTTTSVVEQVEQFPADLYLIKAKNEKH